MPETTINEFMDLLSVDPGVSTGYARWRDGVLTACGVCPELPVFRGIDRMIIEVPRVYTSRLMKGDPNDLIILAVRVGRYIERYSCADLRTVYPGEWKGQVSKDAHHPKIWAALSHKEQTVVAAAGRTLGKKALGDLMDSIGLGLYAKKMGWHV